MQNNSAVYGNTQVGHFLWPENCILRYIPGDTHIIRMLTCILQLPDSEKRKQSQYPSVGEWICSIWYGHRMEYYAEVRRNGPDQYINMESSQNMLSGGKRQVSE